MLGFLKPCQQTRSRKLRAAAQAPPGTDPPPDIAIVAKLVLPWGIVVSGWEWWEQHDPTL